MGTWPWHGLVAYIAQIMAFVNEIMAHLVNNMTMPATMFGKGAIPYGATAGQYILNMSTLPNLTPKGEDIIASIMTIVHNGVVFVAQISTLLPYNALT